MSRTLERVDWNAEHVRGDLGAAAQQLKQEPGNGPTLFAKIEEDL